VKNLVAVWLVALAAASGAEAQSLRWFDHTGHYGAFGAGHHGLTLTCDSLCPADPQGTSSFDFGLGRHITPRVRLEIGFSVGMNADRRSTFLTAGASGYLVGGLYVRGAATFSQVDINDSTSTIFTYRGGPGFLVGGGFDIALGRTWALTPSVSYALAPAKSITVTGGSTTSGSYHSLNFAVSLTRLAGMYQCTNRAGERIWVRPRDRERALACLAQIEGGASRRGIKL
jgi:hypothetical protein